METSIFENICFLLYTNEFVELLLLRKFDITMLHGKHLSVKKSPKYFGLALEDSIAVCITVNKRIRTVLEVVIKMFILDNMRV